MWALEQTNVHRALAPREGWSSGYQYYNTYGNNYLLWSLRAVDMMMAPIQYATPMKQKKILWSLATTPTSNQQLLGEARAWTGVNAVVVCYSRVEGYRLPTVLQFTHSY